MRGRNKKIRRARSLPENRHWQLSDETKRGITTVAVFVIAFLSLLAFLQAAGAFGQWLNYWQSWLFGWGDWLVPLLLLLIGYFLLRPSAFDLRLVNYLGAAIIIVSFSGLLHLLVRQEELASVVRNGRGGGYLGYLTANTLYQSAALPASVAILIAALLVGLFIFFNASFQALARWWMQLRLTLERLRPQAKPWEEDLDAADASDAEPADQDEAEVTEASVAEEVSAGFIQPRPKIPAEAAKKLVPAPARLLKPINLPLELLIASSELPASGDVKAIAKKIETTLRNFGIEVVMGEATVGPTVTQYTLKPAEGIKLNQITALQNDLALALAAHPIRIEAPIPGKSLVGVEVPNQAVSIVKLREILESPIYLSRRSNLMLALGKDVTGRVMMANLDKMPHLLIAGATGSGKSVCINSMLTGLLYQNAPDLLKLILIDPKRVELAVYNGIPHLITPVITDIEKTINALRWAVSQMEERYKMLSAANQRNIESYNQSRLLDKLPYLVIIIDELADLMAVAPKEVESSIIRLAQMARAVGIHLILATQRPSVNVITGLIKANITSRIAFAVASATDSRTIIDSSGAEKLLGNGDMLYISAELSKPKRIQGALISDQEINAVVNYLKERGEPQYDDSVTERQAAKGITGGSYEASQEDQDLRLAIEVVVQAKRASATLLQSRMRVGFAKASRLLDLMEERGIIGPQNSSKPREVLISEAEMEQLTGGNAPGTAIDEDDQREIAPENGDEAA